MTLMEVFITRGAPGVVEELDALYQEYLKSKEPEKHDELPPLFPEADKGVNLG